MALLRRRREGEGDPQSVAGAALGGLPSDAGDSEVRGRALMMEGSSRGRDSDQGRRHLGRSNEKEPRPGEIMPGETADQALDRLLQEEATRRSGSEVRVGSAPTSRPGIGRLSIGEPSVLARGDVGRTSHFLPATMV